MTKRGWLWIAILVVLAAVAGTAAWYFLLRPVPVEMAKVRSGQATELVYATGFVEAQQPVSVQARITAPVERILVKEGDRVVRGQPLFVLSADEQHALVAQAEAQRRAAEQTEKRTVTLFKQGWVTKAARDQAVANADAARAGVATARARQDQLIVRAEIDGVVTRRDIEPGELATPSRVLAQLGDPARTRVTATIDERDIARVRLGQQALMTGDAWPNRSMPATVSELTPSGDPAQRAFRARLQPGAGVDLPLGLSLEINILTSKVDKAILVPATAYEGNHVWVVSDGRAEKRAVKVGISGIETIQIVSGLKPGETVILSPPADLADDQRVAEKR